MAFAISEDLVCSQGYRPTDVVILTPYLGQLKLIGQVLDKYMTAVVSERDQEQMPQKEDPDEMPQVQDV